MIYIKEIEENPGDVYQDAYSKLVDSYFKFGRTPAVIGYLREEAIFAFNRLPIELKARSAQGLENILNKIDNVSTGPKINLEIKKMSDA